MPNSEVKRRSADGSGVSPCESRELPGIKQKARSKDRAFILRLKNPVPKGAGFAVWYISPVALRLPGLQILGHLLAEGHQCRKVTDVNRSLLQPAAHTSNSITDTVAPDRPFQSALSP